MKSIGTIAVVALAGLMWMSGCSQNCATCGQDCQGNCPATKSTSASPAEGGTAKAAQTTCPVGGEAIDKAVFVEYKGEKVYFCCPGCITKFEKDPEQYMAKLN